MLTLNDGRSELWQWDTGRTLAVDADCSQVHFSNKVFGRSIDVDVVDGVANIPDILLQTDKDLNVWAFVGTAENGYTKISKTFKVNRRNKPADYVFTPAEQMTLNIIQRQIGDLSDLTTEAKDTLVAAINEAARTGGGGGSMDLRVADGYVQYSTDGGMTWTNLIAMAELKGADGITPTIGSNGNWYLGDTDTGKPSRGEKGDRGNNGPAGEAGGFYTPAVTQPDANTMRFAFTPSKEGMPAVEPVDITLPAGGGGTTTHGIVWNLVNVTSSNNAISVADGASLVAVLTPADGYTLGDVTITMGGEVVTGAWNADTATVTIQSVTGDVIISCAGVEQSTGEPIDTSPVIAKSGYAYRSISTTSPNVVLTAKAGLCVTKIYEFTPNVAAIEAHPSYDAGLGYINGNNQIGMFMHFVPNSKYLESGATDPGSTYKKAAYFVDGELQTTLYDNLNSQSGEFNASSGLAKKVLQKTVNGIAFTLFEADAEDSYAYWTKTNNAGTYQENAVLPVGVNDGDIIFAGKNTPYYGMQNINGTTGGSTASAGLSFDNDIAQNYAVSASILGEDTAADPNKEYGISADLAAVIDEVRTAWMTEYGGDYRKIPLVITTDQHARTNSGIFNMLGKTLSLHDVSKIINLGDTVSVEWYDEDTTKPLVSCAQLEKWCESIKAIPFSKRLDVYGNHDTWYGNYDDEGNTVGTRYPENQSHLDQYFRNIYARRNNNNGWFVIRDDYFNVKYVVISGFEYSGGVTFRIGTKQMQFIIDEFSKDDGYDIVVVSHVPLYYQPSTEVYPTGMTPSDAGSETISRVSNVDTDALFNGRKNKTSGSVTDSDGVEHTFDFSGCTTDILCGLHGHIHMDAYNYVGGNGLMSATFDWFDGSTIHFALVDRINRQMNIWKIDGDSLTYQNYQVPLDKPAE